MRAKRIHLEMLLGKKVVDIDGKPAGRIEEFVAQDREREGDTVITEFLLGRAGLAERLSIPGLAFTVLRFLGAAKGTANFRVPWDQMDLSVPSHPRLRCGVKDLKSVDRGRKKN